MAVAPMDVAQMDVDSEAAAPAIDVVLVDVAPLAVASVDTAPAMNDSPVDVALTMDVTPVGWVVLVELCSTCLYNLFRLICIM